MNEIKGIIFDWAGTTVDYGCFAPVQAFAEVFRHFGIEPTSQEVREPMGMLKIDHIRTMLRMPRISALWEEKYGRKPEEKDVKELFGLFEEKLMSILHLFAGPKPGVAETVKALREKGIAIGSTTGYTDKMMEIIIPIAREKGYEPECWFSPDSTGQKGRPYPYMIFRNMETLGIDDVRKVLKVGDTASDIKEGKHAGVWSAGVIVGSSEMGLTEEEYEALSPEEKERCSNSQVAGKGWGLPMCASAMVAYAAHALEDERLGREVWDCLFTELYKTPEPQREVEYVTGIIQEKPGISTNTCAQWCLNVITSLELVGKYLPSEPLQVPVDKFLHWKG